MLITKKSLLAAIAKHDGELTADYMTSSSWLRSWWKKSHIDRTTQLIRKILRNGWIWQDEKGKLFVTDHGKAKLAS